MKRHNFFSINFPFLAQHCDTPPSAASQRRAKYRRDSTSIEWSSRETDHSSILTGFGGSSTNTNSPNLGSYGQPVGCPSPALRKNGSIEITSNPMFVVGALADPTMENVSRNSSPSLNSKFEKKKPKDIITNSYMLELFLNFN